MASVVELAPRAGDNWNPPGGEFNDATDDSAVLVFIERRRFAGGTHGNDGVRTRTDVEFDQPRKTVIVDRTIRPHRRDQRDHTAVEHASSPGIENPGHTTGPVRH